MNKKRFLSMLLMAALVIQIFPASAGAATVKQDVTLEGEIDVVNPIYDIIIPTNLDFQVDSFGIFSEDPRSIISTGYAIVNRSPMAVQVDITASLQSASSGALTFKDAVGDVSTEDPANTDAELYFEVRPATTAPIVTSGTFTYSAVTPGSVNITGPATTIGWITSPSALTYASGQAIDTTTGNSVSFVMAKSPNAVKAAVDGQIEYQDGHTASDDAIAFKFDGALNPYAQWGEGNLANFKVVAKFSFNALTVKGYDKVKTELSDAKGHGYLGTASTGGGTSIKEATVSKTSPTDAVYNIKSANQSATISDVTVFESNGTTKLVTLAPAAYTKSGSQFKILSTAGLWANSAVTNGKTFIVKVTFSNSAVESYTLKITA